MRACSTLLASLAGIALFFVAAPIFSAPGDPLPQQQARQAQIRVSTDRVAQQLASILDDFRQNGISGQDVQQLEVIRGVLQSISAEDMQTVLKALETAGQASDPVSALNEALAAYAGQKAVSAKLRAVIHEYLRLAEAYELAQRFREFAHRETTLMWRTVALARQTEGKSTNSFSEPEQGELRLLQIDQDPLKDELVPLLNKLEEVESGMARDRATASPRASRYAKESNLLPSLDAAARGLQQARLHSVAGDQRTARNHLREIARLLVLSQGRAAALRQALSDLDHALDGQRQMAGAIEKAESRDAKLEPRQAEVADTTDLVRNDLESLVPAAAQDLSRAIALMNQTREVLDQEHRAGPRRDKIMPLQAQAISAIEQARRAVQEQLELAEKKNEVLPETLAELEELLKQVRQLIADQSAFKEETAALEAGSPGRAEAAEQFTSKAARQGELQERTQSVQQRAGIPCPPASQFIGEAAAHMHKSQVSLAAAQNDALAQQAAIDALKRAEQQLQKELLSVQQAQQELGKLTALLQKLIAIISQQQKLQFATARAAANSAATGLAQQQKDLGADTVRLRDETASTAPSAASHLGNAQTHMTQALAPLQSLSQRAQPEAAVPPTNSADKVGAVTNAVARQTEALKELYAAREVIEKQLANIQDKFSPTNSAASLADAAAKIDEAQLQLQRALAQLQAPPPGLLQSLLQQQREIVDGLNHVLPREQPPPSLRAAHSAAAQAAQGLAQMNVPAAVAAMQRAQASMKQAVSAGQDMDGKVPKLATQQEHVRQLAEALLATQNAVPPADVSKAGQMLANAGEMLAPVTAGAPGQLPAPAQSSLEAAQAALAAGAAQAFSGQGSPAQANASAAAEALAEAQSALALARAGLNSQSAAAGQKGQVQGQGQATGDGQNAGQPNAQASPNSKGNGRTGNWSGQGGADGPRRGVTGEGKFTRLPPRERAALLQSQVEKYPQEYGPLIEQYLKNLADEPK